MATLLVVGGCVLGCGSLQRDANDRAAQIADYTVRDGLKKSIAAANADSPQERAQAALNWLRDPNLTQAETQGGTWIVKGSEGTTIRVDVYRKYESGALLPPEQGKSAWGVACRTYDVSTSVTVSSIVCPDGTSDEP